MTIRGFHFSEGGKTYSIEETTQLISALETQIQLKSGQIVIMESERSLGTAVRFLALLRKKLTVMMLPSVEFQDRRFLELLSLQLGAFSLWPLNQNLPLAVSGDAVSPVGFTSGFLVKSSGTSGKGPKIILHDPELFLRKFIGKEPTFEKTLNFFPPDSIAGIETLFEAMVHGKTIINPGIHLGPSSILRILENEEVDFLHLTPTFLNLLLLHGLSPTHLRSVKTLAFGSEPSQVRVLKIVSRMKATLKLNHIYGMSEIGLQETITRGDDPSFFQLDENINPARITDGILEVKTKTPPLKIMPDKAPASEWFPTGDVVEQDGLWLKVIGRNDDTMNVAGKKFFPSRLEEILMELAGVDDVTVTSEPNEFIGTAVIARILTKLPEEVVRVQLKKFMEEKVPSYMRPQKIEVISATDLSVRLKKKRR